MRITPAYLIALIALTSLGVVLLFFAPRPVEADQHRTTEEAAASAGATVLKTAPPLRVEPKGYRQE